LVHGGIATVASREARRARLTGAAEPGSSPRVGKKRGELQGVLTEGFGGWFDGEARSAVVKGEQQR
jgi:hypothetical protein